jgi:hypothetical protein
MRAIAWKPAHGAPPPTKSPYSLARPGRASPSHSVVGESATLPWREACEKGGGYHAYTLREVHRTRVEKPGPTTSRPVPMY